MPKSKRCLRFRKVFDGMVPTPRPRGDTHDDTGTPSAIILTLLEIVLFRVTIDARPLRTAEKVCAYRLLLLSLCLENFMVSNMIANQNVIIIIYFVYHTTPTVESTPNTDLELPSMQKDPAGQVPEHRKLVSCVEEPKLPAAQGNLPPFVQ